MHQLITSIILLAVSLLLNGAYAAYMASLGAWGEATGLLFIGPLLVSYAVAAALYYPTRAIRGPDKVADYSRSKLHYVGLAVSLMSMLGQAGMRAQQVGV